MSWLLRFDCPPEWEETPVGCCGHRLDDGWCPTCDQCWDCCQWEADAKNHLDELLSLTECDVENGWQHPDFEETRVVGVSTDLLRKIADGTLAPPPRTQGVVVDGRTIGWGSAELAELANSVWKMISVAPE